MKIIKAFEISCIATQLVNGIEKTKCLEIFMANENSKSLQIFIGHTHAKDVVVFVAATYACLR